MKNWFSKNKAHFIVIGLFVAITFMYFSPIFEGKVLYQQDALQAKAMGKEITTIKEETGKAPLWTNAMFGGMPAYQIWIYYPGSITTYIIQLWSAIFPTPTNIVLLYLLGAYLLFNVLRLKPWLAFGASIAIAFSSYNFIIIEAGHANKALAIALFAPIVAGILLTLRGKRWMGASITALALAIEIRTNHLQMTYYLMLAILVLMLMELYDAIRSKQIEAYVKSVGYLFVALLLGIAVNTAMLWSNYEYGNLSIRGKSNIINVQNPVKSGLDKDYAFQWSYGVKETLTLLVPNFYGGASQEKLTENSEVGQALQSNNVENWQQYLIGMPTYWGTQPFTSGPVYFGSIIIFLFILGLLIVKDRLKWWLLVASILSIILSWGKNFSSLSYLLFDYLPLYNKFRAVSSILVIAGLCMPILAFLAAKEIANHGDEKRLIRALKIALGIVGGALILMILMPNLWGVFESVEDAQLPEWLRIALKTDRASMLKSDAIRALIFILVSVGFIWAFLKQKITENTFFVVLSLLVLVDLWSINKRYLNQEKFVSKYEIEQNAFPLREVDKQILEDKDPNYRVLDITVPTFSSATTSYYHKTIGGYHAAKLKRFQELIDYQFNKINPNVLDMLNTKYVIFSDDSLGRSPMVERNHESCGNAWFVQKVVYAEDEKEEMNLLKKIDVHYDVIVNKQNKKLLNESKLGLDPNALISLTSYHPDRLQYEYSTTRDGIAVFSEIYYDKGWNMYLDGNLYPYFRANYLLRAAQLPMGNHRIEFRFEPTSYYIGDNISLVASGLLIALLGLSLYKNYKEMDINI